MQKPSLHALWTGLTAFEKSLQMQTDLLQQSKEFGSSYLLGLEHPPTITLGKRGRKDIDILWTEEELLRRGIECHVIERGGEATLHSPGQLVIYPILPLRQWGWTVRHYVSQIIDVTRLTLEELGVKTSCGPQEPGLFTDEGKIAAFGVRIKHGVTQHGLAINCSNSLQLFESIRSCGVERQKWTRLQSLGLPLSPRDVFKIWHRQFLLTIPDRQV